MAFNQRIPKFSGTYFIELRRKKSGINGDTLCSYNRLQNILEKIKIKQNWTKLENFDVCFYVIFERSLVPNINIWRGDWTLD